VLKVIFIFIFFINYSLNAYESEDKLKVVIVGKVAKYVEYQNEISDNFIITILKNRFGTLFDDIYKDKKIKSKPVKILYIDNIDQLSLTNILYIPKVNSQELSKIFEQTHNKNILTISDMRGFAQKGGVMQLYFVSQKIKIKINTNSASRQNLKIKSTLLRISDVVKEDKP